MAQPLVIITEEEHQPPAFMPKRQDWLPPPAHSPCQRTDDCTLPCTHSDHTSCTISKPNTFMHYPLSSIAEVMTSLISRHDLRLTKARRRHMLSAKQQSAALVYWPSVLWNVHAVWQRLGTFRPARLLKERQKQSRSKVPRQR